MYKFGAAKICHFFHTGKKKKRTHHSLHISNWLLSDNIDMAGNKKKDVALLWHQKQSYERVAA